VPISNWAAFGGSKEVIIWMPIDMIAQTITQVIAVRKQIIEDIYQIMGLSDIMRGATDPGETLGAQQLKSQYGSVRIRDKQGEMVRVARDIEEITAEIMCSDFKFETLLQMSQMEIPTQDEQQQKIFGLQQQMQMIQQQAMQMAQQPQLAPPQPGAPPQPQPPPPQQNPEAMKQLEQQYTKLQGDMEDEQQRPTQELIEQFIADYRTTAFVLDIETDSTIQADENAEKQRRGEFMGMMAQLIPQLAALVAAQPGAAEFCGELLKFSVAPFRVGRTLDGSIDNLVEQVEAMAAQRVGKPDPKLEAEQQKLEATTQLEIKKLEAQKAEADGKAQLEMTKLQQQGAIEAAKLQGEQRVAMFEAESKRRLEESKMQQMGVKMQHDAMQHEQKMQEEQQKMALHDQVAQQKAVDAQNRNADMASRRQLSERNQLFKERQAAVDPYPSVLG